MGEQATPRKRATTRKPATTRTPRTTTKKPAATARPDEPGTEEATEFAPPAQARAAVRAAEESMANTASEVTGVIDDNAVTFGMPPAGHTPWTPDRPLRNVSEVRHFFRTNTTPIYFVGATSFNLLGLDRWVRNFSYITYYDSWDGLHPRVFTPQYKPYVEFESGSDINNWLLENPEVRAHIDRQRTPGQRPKIVMVFFDEETERICDELGYDLILPTDELRQKLDSKIVTTQLGDEVGVPSVPNIITTVESYDDLLQQCEASGIGSDVVIQTAYGDSGKTTFFVADETTWQAHSEEIVGHEVKVMRRIDNRPIAVEAVITGQGTIVGPFMTELTGHARLTPYRGGWCGNEMFPDVLDEDTRDRAGALVRTFGDRLGKEGYRGFFEVDLLIDIKTNDVYLGELNPRISGASSITGVTAGAYADVPLFCFHLLEYLDVEFELDIDEINARWRDLASQDQWSQMMIKEIDPIVERISTAAPTGLYRIDEAGNLVYRRGALDWHQLEGENEAFYLRIYGPGDYRWKGADLGVVVAPGRLQRTTSKGEQTLTIRAKHLIDSVRLHYSGVSIKQPEQSSE